MSESAENSSRTTAAHRDYTAAYVGILNTYNSQISDSVSKKNELKSKFFSVIKGIMISLTVLFSLSIVLSFVLFFLMVGSQKNTVELLAGAITAIISSLSTMVLSIFKLPKIIADYLFNKEEDKLMNEIIKNIQKYEIDTLNLELTGIQAAINTANDEVIDYSPADEGVERAIQEMENSTQSEVS